MTVDQFRRAREITGEIQGIHEEIEAVMDIMNTDSIQIIGSIGKVPSGNLRLKTEEVILDNEIDMLRCTNEEPEKCDYCINKNQCDREERLREEQGTSKEFKYRNYR